MYSQAEGLEERNEFIYNILKDRFEGKYEIVTKREFYHEISYYNIPAAFDIETTSWYNKSGLKCATMYWWTIGIYNHVTYGRTYAELQSIFQEIIEALSITKDLRIALFIHNLPYEWQFIRKHFQWDKCFFIESRKPLYCQYNGIELRDSLKLAMKKLSLVGKDLTKYPVQKMVGDLDYSKIRHYKTPLTDAEKKYCENDVRVILSYIQEKIEQDKGIHNIPLTNTGYVRNYCRRACYGYGKRNYKHAAYKRIMDSLIMTADEYIHIRNAYQGGYTHASQSKVGRFDDETNGIVHDDLGSYDFTSSYPYTLIAEKFPMSSATYYKELTEKELLSLTEDFCITFRVTFTKGLSAKPGVPDLYISKSKIGYVNEEHDEPITYNGRIFGTDESFYYDCVDQDLFTILQVYDIPKGSMRFTSIYAYRKGYLPTVLVKAIIALYKDKTLLKGVPEKLMDYMIKKGMLNSVYGMMVTDIVREMIKYVDDKYKTEVADIEKEISKYNNNPKRFLFYPWGVWVTAYARANLWSGILACGGDYIYSDTDSVKLRNYMAHEDYFKTYNETVIHKLEAAARYHKIPLSDLIPEVNGKKYPLGVWDYEGKYPDPAYSEFKTLGAKRYFAKYFKPMAISKLNKKTKLHWKGFLLPTNIGKITEHGLRIAARQYLLTVAGTGKESTRYYLLKMAIEQHKKPMDLFNFDLYIPPEHTGKQCLTYVDCDLVELREELTDYLGNTVTIHEKSFVHMEPKDYNFSQESQFFEFLMLMEDWF